MREKARAARAVTATAQRPTLGHGTAARRAEKREAGTEKRREAAGGDGGMEGGGHGGITGGGKGGTERGRDGGMD